MALAFPRRSAEGLSPDELPLEAVRAWGSWAISRMSVSIDPDLVRVPLSAAIDRCRKRKLHS